MYLVTGKDAFVVQSYKEQLQKKGNVVFLNTATDFFEVINQSLLMNPIYIASLEDLSCLDFAIVKRYKDVLFAKELYLFVENLTKNGLYTFLKTEGRIKELSTFSKEQAVSFLLTLGKEELGKAFVLGEKEILLLLKRTHYFEKDFAFDLYYVYNEMLKVCFLVEEEMSVSERCLLIEEQIEDVRDTNYFSLANLVLEKNQDAAMRLLQTMKEGFVVKDGICLTGILAYRYRILYKALLLNQEPPKDVLKQIGVVTLPKKQGFLLKDAAKGLDAIMRSAKQLKNGYDAFLITAALVQELSG